MGKTKKRMKKGTGLLIAGLVLVLAGAGLTGKNFYDSRQAELYSADALSELLAQMPEAKPVRGNAEAYLSRTGAEDPGEVPAELTAQEQAEIPLFLLDPEIPMPKLQSGGRLYIGMLNIPTLGLELPVLDDCTTSGLKLAPCRWSGSAYRNDLVICAHNYQKHFGTLKNLVPDDAVSFTDADGNLFTYRVVLVETLGPDDVDYVENSEYDLTLYTCTVGGQTRVTVRCLREADD